MNMPLNHRGEPLEETQLFCGWTGAEETDSDRDCVIGLILAHLGMKAIKTNSTKHGDFQIQLHADDI